MANKKKIENLSLFTLDQLEGTAMALRRTLRRLSKEMTASINQLASLSERLDIIEAELTKRKRRKRRKENGPRINKTGRK